MKGSYLGEFEEIVLLAVAILHDEAYGYAIGQQIEAQTGRSVSLSAVHSALHRLEKKEFLTSRLAGATTKRGGKRRRFFTMTACGESCPARSPAGTSTNVGAGASCGVGY